VNAEQAFGLAGGQAFFGVETQAAFEFRQPLCGHGKAGGESVSAEAGEEACAAFDGVEQRKAVHRAARAVSHAVLDADDNGRLGGALNHARGQNTDHAPMPAVPVHHEQALSGQFRI
jgi:hypothetical protein